MDGAKIVSRDEWLAARQALVTELTRLRDQFMVDCALPSSATDPHRNERRAA